jgi:nitrous oxidase accessory protein
MRRIAAVLVVSLMLAMAGTVLAGQPSLQPPTSNLQPQSGFDLKSALADAQDGDTIEVPGGTYPGPIVIDKSLKLIGKDRPIVTGDRSGTVVTITAPDVTFEGFIVQGSGREPDQNHSAIFANGAPRVTLRNNEVRESLFGIYLASSPDSVVDNNVIRGDTTLESGRRGDGLRLWESDNTTLSNNQVLESRDVVLWYSKGLRIHDNVIRDGRYGIHFMYSANADVERNLITGNSIGVFLMYSDNVNIRRNIFQHNRGPSGYGLGFKDNDGAVIEDNLILDNRVGIFLDNSPFTPDSVGLFTRNEVSFNDIGVSFMPSTRGNMFAENTFRENQEQVSIQGGGVLRRNDWSRNGRGNFWSDYAERGYDAGGDGVGDVAYESDRLFENLADTNSALRFFIYSPAVQAIEFAAQTFPLAKPVPKLKDEHPLMESPIDPAALLPQPETRTSTVPMWLASLSLTTAALAVIGVGARRRRGFASRPFVSAHTRSAAAAIAARRVSKRFSSHVVLKELSFDVQPGESLALWGANGAGKTTLIKSLLGVHNFEGEITLGGHDVRRQGRQARQLIGYVPQELAFVDLSARAALTFYARLKKVDGQRVEDLLAQVGLSEHADKALGALSGGMKQRLALAAALLADPPVLILDEPTANLDAAARADFIALVAALRSSGKTIVFSSHRMDEVQALADRVLMLKEGVSQGIFTMNELLEHLGEPVTLRLQIDAAQLPEVIEKLKQAGLTGQVE